MAGPAAHHALEGSAEGAFRFVSERARNRTDGFAARQAASGEQHPPAVKGLQPIGRKNEVIVIASDFKSSNLKSEVARLSRMRALSKKCVCDCTEASTELRNLGSFAAVRILVELTTGFGCMNILVRSSFKLSSSNVKISRTRPR